MRDCTAINNECTGCGACLVKCPVKCIQLKKNEEGFYYPIVEQSKCIYCGLCYKICPAATFVRKNIPIHSFAALSKFKAETKKSSSGGAFFTFAKYVIDYGGIVFGTKISENYAVEISCTDEEERLSDFQGSKYVQASAEKAYEQAKEYLKEGKRVLFTGTPCQIAGLYACVGNPDNLVTIDLICHGTPSPGFFSDYIKKITFISGKQAEKINFRYKDERYRTSFSLRIFEKNKLWYDAYSKMDAYYNLFMEGATYRESCYTCQYAQEKRVGDITIGDLGSYQEYPEFYLRKATSVILLNTNKGINLWNSVKKNFEYKDISLEKEKASNCQLNHPVKRPENRNFVFKDFRDMSFKRFCNKYRGRLTLKEWISLKIKKNIPSSVLYILENKRKED